MKAACDDWTKIPLNCAKCGVQFLRKVKGQRYCDEHRYLAGAVIRPQGALTSNELAVALRALAFHAEAICSSPTPSDMQRELTRMSIARALKLLGVTTVGEIEGNAPETRPVDWEAEYKKLAGVYTREGLEKFIADYWPGNVLADASASEKAGE